MSDIPPSTFTVERGRVRLFAQVVGERGTVHDDLDVARAAGHPDLLVPPTFFYSAEIEDPEGFAFLADLGVCPDETILHGEQRFEYLADVHAGDTLLVEPRVGSVQPKKGGTMLMVERLTEFRRDGELVARGATTLVILRREESA